jgi:hypothetical protein
LAFGSLPFGLLHITEPQLGYGQRIRFEAFANQLASHFKSGKVNAGWNVTDKICELRFLPQCVGGRLFFVAHLGSIRMRYQIVKSGYILSMQVLGNHWLHP